MHLAPRYFNEGFHTDHWGNLISAVYIDLHHCKADGLSLFRIQHDKSGLTAFTDNYPHHHIDLSHWQHDEE